MAVKNSKSKTLNANYRVVMELLRSLKFATLIEAKFIEEVKTQKNADCIEFRYIKKMSLLDHGRNFFIIVPQIDGDTTTVTITTQSRKITVLIDTVWESSIDRVISVLEALL